MGEATVRLVEAGDAAAVAALRNDREGAARRAAAAREEATARSALGV